MYVYQNSVHKYKKLIFSLLRIALMLYSFHLEHLKLHNRFGCTSHDMYEHVLLSCSSYKDKDKDKDPFIGPQEFVVGYSKAPEQPQSSARPICHSHAMTRTGRDPTTIRIAAYRSSLRYALRHGRRLYHSLLRFKMLASVNLPVLKNLKI